MIISLLGWLSGGKKKGAPTPKGKVSGLSKMPSKTDASQTDLKITGLPASHEVSGRRPETSTGIPVGGDKQDRIGTILIKYNIINNDKLQQALAIQAQTKPPKFLGEIMLEQKMLTEDDMVFALSRRYKIPYIKISKYSIRRELLRMIPEEIIKKHLILPINKMGQWLTVAMVNPQDTDVIAELKRLTGCSVNIILCKLSEVKDAIKTLYGTIPEEAASITTCIVLDEPAPEEKAASTTCSPATEAIAIAEIPFPKPPVKQPEPETEVLDKLPAVAIQPVEPPTSPDIPDDAIEALTPVEESAVEEPQAVSEEVVLAPEAESEEITELSASVESVAEAQTEPEAEPIEPQETAVLSTPQTPAIDEPILLTPEPEAELVENESVLEPEPLAESDSASVPEEPVPEPEPMLVPEPEPVVETETVAEPQIADGTSVDNAGAEIAASEPVISEEPISETPVEEEPVMAELSSAGPEDPDMVASAAPAEPELIYASATPLSEAEFARAVRITSQFSTEWDQRYQRNRIEKAVEIPEEEFNFYRLL